MCCYGAPPWRLRPTSRPLGPLSEEHISHTSTNSIHCPSDWCCYIKLYIHSITAGHKQLQKIHLHIHIFDKHSFIAIGTYEATKWLQPQ